MLSKIECPICLDNLIDRDDDPAACPDCKNNWSCDKCGEFCGPDYLTLDRDEDMVCDDCLDIAGIHPQEM